MNRARLSAFALIALLAAIAGGCAKSPTAQHAQAMSAMTTTQNLIRQRHQAGLLDDADIVALDPYVQAARAGVIEAGAGLPEGGPFFETALRAAMTSLEHLSIRLAEQEQN